MKYKRFVYTQLVLIVMIFELAAAKGRLNEILEMYNSGSKLERVLAMWNRSSENFHQSASQTEREANGLEKSTSAGDFPSEVKKCIAEHQSQITENLTQGKNAILNCFKATFMLNLLRYLEDSPKSSIKLFDGLLEFKRIPETASSGRREELEDCDENHERNFDGFPDRKNEYVRMYKKALEKLISERKKFNAYRNRTEAEKADQLDRINRNSQAFLSEVIKTLGDENLEKVEEDKLKREMADPNLLSVLDVFSRNYMLKFRFFPGVAARMMRSRNGGFTFDVEVQDSSEDVEEDISSDEGSTREIKDGPQGKDYFDYDDDDKGGKKKRKDDKKKKKKIKKKAKELKKIIPYLLLPMLIQMTLLPFVFKKLFFLAMKALFAGKVALLLVGFNLLRNTCIKNDDDFQKIRVEHYGYRKGEEYGAWINGRALGEPSVVAALSEEPFRRQNSLRSEASR